MPPAPGKHLTRVLQPRPRLRGWIHGAAVPCAAITAAALWRAAEPGVSRLSIAVFGIGLVTLYLVSSVYHLPPWPEPVRRWLARIDTAMIQLFIAAAFTPFAVHALHGPWRSWSLVVAWGMSTP